MKSLLRKVIVTLLAAAMMMAAASVLVVAAAFALYGVLKEYVGGPGANALVALAAAVLMGGTAFLLERWILKPGPAGHAGAKKGMDEETLLQKLVVLAQGRPIIAVGALIGAVALAIRNPALTSIVVKAFLDPKSRPPKK